MQSCWTQRSNTVRETCPAKTEEADSVREQQKEGSTNLPDTYIIAVQIVEDLQAALAQFAEIASDLKR